MTFTTQFIPLNCAVLKRKNDKYLKRGNKQVQVYVVYEMQLYNLKKTHYICLKTQSFHKALSVCQALKKICAKINFYNITLSFHVFYQDKIQQTLQNMQLVLQLNIKILDKE